MRSVMMALLGTHWGSLGTRSPASSASALGTWTPMLWVTVTPCLATACVACTTRQALTVTTVRKASTGTPWPLGPQTGACVSTHGPGPRGGDAGPLLHQTSLLLCQAVHPEAGSSPSLFLAQKVFGFLFSRAPPALGSGPVIFSFSALII